MPLSLEMNRSGSGEDAGGPGVKPKPPCTWSGTNLAGYDVEPEEDISEMVIDITAVKEKFKQYRLYTKGYRGLGVFILFAIWYLIILGQQHHEPSTGQANSGIRDFFEKSKADLKVQDTVTAWKFFSAKIIPLLHGVPWNSKRNNTYHQDENTGGKAFEYFYNIGGVAITAVKSETHTCFRGQPCYSLDPKTDPFYQLKLANGNTFHVPYNEYMGGYTVGLPSSTTPANLMELLMGYTALMGPDTRHIHMDAILFNPSGQKTITSVRITASVSIDDVITMSLTLDTIPYHLYSSDSQTTIIQVTSQILMIIFSLIVFVRPFVQAKFKEPQFEPVSNNDERVYEQARIRLDWLAQWHHLPVSRSGELLYLIPATLIGSINVAVLVWIYLIWRYRGVGEFGDSRLDTLFEDPLASLDDADLVTKMTVSLERLGEIGFPLMEQEHDIAQTFSWYFMLQTFIVVIMMVRFLQYLSFQKRLSMVTDTFNDIFDEFFHIAMVLFAICFTLGVMSSLAFGSLDPAFRNFLTSFMEMIELMFGLFKPAATMQINPPLFKYVPHTVIGNEYMNWMPYAIVLIFKVLVTLLLFKLLMGVIMEAYKKKSRLKAQSQSVFAELAEMLRITKYYYWEHKVKGQPFVSFEHVVIAVSNMKHHEKKPWASRFIGFGDGVQAVVAALNNVLCLPDDYSRPRLKAVVKHHGFQRCGEDEALYCMRVFGKNRDIAKYEFRDWILTTEMEKVQKQLQKEAKKNDLTEDHHIKASQQAHVLLHEVAKDLAEIEGRDLLISELKREKIGPEEIDMVFDAYDFYQTGQVDSRFMKCCLTSLGYSLPKKVTGKLLTKYDADENHCFDKSEFQKLLKDKLLLGRRDVMKGKLNPVRKVSKEDVAKVKAVSFATSAFRAAGKMPKMENALVMQVAELAKKYKREYTDPLIEPLLNDEEEETSEILRLPSNYASAVLRYPSNFHMSTKDLSNT